MPCISTYNINIMPNALFLLERKKKKRLYNSSLDQSNKVIQPCISLFYIREHQMAAFSRCHKDALYNVWEQFQITFMAWVAAQYQRRLSSFFRCLIPEPSFQIQPEIWASFGPKLISRPFTAFCKWWDFLL